VCLYARCDQGNAPKRLEYQLYNARQLIPVIPKELCGAQRHCRVRVVAAGVHISVGGGEGQTCLLSDWQTVAVDADTQTFTRLCPADKGDDTASANTILNFLNTDLLKLPDNDPRGFKSLVAQFRDLMQLAPPGDNLILKAPPALSK
jgi:hypothetical protein